MGWLYMILERFPDDTEALDCFFRLLDEYQRRVETAVGTAKTRLRTYYSANLQSREPDENSRPLTKKFKEWSKNVELPHGQRFVRNAYKRPAENLKLVVYTDDPGFFLISTDKPDDCGDFYESLDCARLRLGPKYLTMFKIANQDVFDRLLQENLAYRKKEAKLRAEARKEYRALSEQTHPSATESAHSTASPA